MTPQREPQLKEIAIGVPAWDASTLGSELAAYFKDHPEIPGIVLTHQGAFAAALSREDFQQALAQPLGTEIFGHRPLSALIERPAFHPMPALPPETPASEALTRALEKENARTVLVEGATAMAGLRALISATLETLRKTSQSLGAEARARANLEKEIERAHNKTDEAHHAKSKFLASVGHEIRTPMNGIIGITGLLLESPLPPKNREYVRTVQKSANHLLEILDEFLDFSKAEAHVLTLDIEDFNLLETVENVIEEYGPPTGEKGVELAEFVASNVPHHLRGDSARLIRILDHLVENAVKNTQQGEVVVTVSRENETPTHVLLRFEIRDTGTNLCPADPSALFAPSGMNPELAICQKFVELMGGTISIQRAPGGGNLLWFTARFEKQTGAPSPAAPPVSDLCGMRALIVDDNPTNRHILHCQLSSWRMVPTCVSNAAEALATLKRALNGKPFDVALLDMQMPGQNGLELARAIRKDPTIASLRLILLSSLGPVPQREVQSAGIAACLVKPVKQSLLQRQIASVIAQPPPRPQQPFEEPMKSRILVAEDNRINQIVTMGQLDKLGYHGELAVNGLEVLAALRKTHYPIILMDCQMPLMDGYEATRRIRANHELPRQPRIIAVTAHAMAGDCAKCLASGMDDYISKPVKLEDLATKIAHWEANPYPPSSTPGAASAAPLVSTACALNATPEPNATLEAPALDRERLEILKNLDPDNGPEFYRKLLETFTQSAGDDFRQLRELVARHDWPLVKTKAHSLKGSSRNMGAETMGNLCQEIEALSKEPEKTGEIQTALERLAAEFNRAFAEIQTELATL